MSGIGGRDGYLNWKNFKLVMESFGYISAEENEFFAEETLIEIVPNFDRSAFACLSVSPLYCSKERKKEV